MRPNEILALSDLELAEMYASWSEAFYGEKHFVECLPGLDGGVNFVRPLELKKTTLTTFSLPHARKPKLWYRDGEGVYQSLAILTVSSEEFWAILERELGIKFVDAPPTP